MENIVYGLGVALSLQNLGYAFIGVLIGNIIGIIPGIGALAAISMLLPVTYGLDSTGAIVMLAGIYYGTSFGGATTAILLNLPGTVQHAVVCLDGHQLARQGRAGPAIFMAMLASFLGCCVGVVIVGTLSPLVVRLARQFGPAEYFALMSLGLLAAATISSGSPLRAIGSVLLGLMIGVIGVDVNTGVWRFTFGMPELADGVSLVALALALFGLVDILETAGVGADRRTDTDRTALGSIRPTLSDLKRSVSPSLRGSLIGSFFGALPGTGGALASFMSYAAEKKLSKRPDTFGHGAMEGVAGPEAANSSADITAFIPTLTLGIPGDAVMAVMLGALMIHDITPGPLIMQNHPELFWGLIGSFFIGNVLLLLLNLPLIRIWVRMLTIPYRLIFPVVVLFIMIATYAVNNSLVDVAVMLCIGLAGALLKALRIPPAPLLLAFVLGPLVEENFRRALVISRGNLDIFITRPISGALIAIGVILVAVTVARRIRRT